MRYVSLDGEGSDMTNSLNPKDPMESSHVQYHSTPSSQFENVDSNSWTPQENTNIGNSSKELIVGQVFNSKVDLQHAANLYSISTH